jgi:hypothetical protein
LDADRAQVGKQNSLRTLIEVADQVSKLRLGNKL